MAVLNHLAWSTGEVGSDPSGGGQASPVDPSCQALSGRLNSCGPTSQVKQSVFPGQAKRAAIPESCPSKDERTPSPMR